MKHCGRSSRSKRLTRADKQFLQHVPRIFTALQQARDSVRGAANGFHGQQRITLSDGITPSRLPTLLALCWQEEPDVELRLLEVSLSQQIKGLHGDLYDPSLTVPRHISAPPPATARVSGRWGAKNLDTRVVDFSPLIPLPCCACT